MLRNVILVLSLAFATACGGANEYVIVGTQIANAADGVITVEKLESNNMVNIEVTHLAPPERISPGTNVFSVWFHGEGRDPIQQGVLEYDADARTGTFSATTVLTEFVVMVTAEADATSNAPSDAVVFQQEVSAP